VQFCVFVILGVVKGKLLVCPAYHVLANLPVLLFIHSSK